MRLLFVMPLLACALVLSACAIPSSRTNIVVVTENKAVIEGCTQLAVIDGRTAVSDMLLRDTARDSAVAHLKQRAADLDGTHVLAAVGNIKWTGPDRSGIVYRCPPTR